MTMLVICLITLPFLHGFCFSTAHFEAPEGKLKTVFELSKKNDF